MKKESSYIDVEDLEKGDIFYTGREWGFCEIEEILGISFYTGKICFGLKPCNLSKPQSYVELYFKMDKKVRLFD